VALSIRVTLNTKPALQVLINGDGRCCQQHTYSLTWFAGPDGRRPPAGTWVCIHPMNQVNSCDGHAVMRAPQT